MKFQTVLLLGGKTATGLPVPAEIVESLGDGKRPKVRVTLNDYTYRSSIALMGGTFMLPVSEEVRHNAGITAGDTVNVDVELDTEPRVVAVPPDLTEALESDLEARRFFDGLSYSNQLRIVLSIEQARTAETRQRQITKAVENLHEGKA